MDTMEDIVGDIEEGNEKSKQNKIEINMCWKNREKMKTIKHKERWSNTCTIGIAKEQNQNSNIEKYLKRIEKIKLGLQFIPWKIIPDAKQNFT